MKRTAPLQALQADIRLTSGSVLEASRSFIAIHILRFCLCIYHLSIEKVSYMVLLIYHT